MALNCPDSAALANSSRGASLTFPKSGFLGQPNCLSRSPGGLVPSSLLNRGLTAQASSKAAARVHEARSGLSSKRTIFCWVRVKDSISIVFPQISWCFVPPLLRAGHWHPSLPKVKREAAWSLPSAPRSSVPTPVPQGWQPQPQGRCVALAHEWPSPPPLSSISLLAEINCKCFHAGKEQYFRKLVPCQLFAQLLVFISSIPSLAPRSVADGKCSRWHAEQTPQPKRCPYREMLLKEGA